MSLRSLLTGSLLVLMTAFSVAPARAQAGPGEKAASGVGAAKPAAPPSRDANAIELLGTTVVTIDPATEAGESLLYLSNPSNATVELRLIAVPADGRTGRVSILFGDSASSGSKSPFPITLLPASVTPLRVRVAGVTGDGEFSADVFNMGTKLASISVRRAAVGFVLDAPPTAQNPLRIVSGDALRFVPRIRSPRHSHSRGHFGQPRTSCARRPTLLRSRRMHPSNSHAFRGFPTPSTAFRTCSARRRGRAR